VVLDETPHPRDVASQLINAKSSAREDVHRVNFNHDQLDSISRGIITLGGGVKSLRHCKTELGRVSFDDSVSQRKDTGTRGLTILLSGRSRFRRLD
jgi:hypothetical protein